MIVGRRVPHRRGLVSVVLVTGLMILMMISAGLLRLALVRRAELTMAERRLQAEWLVESGLDRAWARLAARPDYPGETWTIPAADLGGRSDAVVTIAVERPEGRRVRVRVRADYPRTGDRRARHSRTMTIDSNSKPTTDRKGDAPR